MGWREHNREQLSYPFHLPAGKLQCCYHDVDALPKMAGTMMKYVGLLRPFCIPRPSDWTFPSARGLAGTAYVIVPARGAQTFAKFEG